MEKYLPEPSLYLPEPRLYTRITIFSTNLYAANKTPAPCNIKSGIPQHNNSAQEKEVLQAIKRLTMSEHFTSAVEELSEEPKLPQTKHWCC